MKVVISGASGLVGTALVPALRTAGHDVVRLVRGNKTGSRDEINWDPAAGRLDPGSLAGVEAFINLAGENLGAGRWTAARRQEILRSRVDATRTLVTAVGRMARKPTVFLNASAVGYYGDCGDAVVTEASKIGNGFLPEVCQAWETHAEGALRLGVRTVLLRFGVILSADGGALAKMLPIFRCGLGGRLGSGRQWMSWISLTDVVRAIVYALTHPTCAGPINLTAPAAVTNAEFTTALAKVLHRPAFLPVPAWALRLALGRGMADEALLSSTRAAPQRLSELGFGFRHQSVAAALGASL